MNPTDFTQLGIAGIALFIIWFMVKYFVETLTKKDTQIAEITKDFTKVISNHIVHETKAWNQTCKTLNNLNKVTNKLYNSQDSNMLSNIKKGIDKLNEHQSYQEGKTKLVADKLDKQNAL